MKSNYSIIESKLNDFVRKFYSNRIIVGVMLFLLIFSVSLFSVFMIESFSFMPPSVKTLLFYFLVFIFASVFIYFILIPTCKIFKIIPFLSNEEAASIISDYFPNSQDLLLNIIQLHKDESNDFVVAAINQKIDKISPFNFANAIDIKKTFRFLGISLGVLCLLLTTSFIFKNNVISGANRFLNYSVYYQPENPYTTTLLNDSLYCAYGEDFTLHLKLDGPSLPNDVFINIPFLKMRMACDSAGFYSYTIKNLTQDLPFSFEYLDFHTNNHTISVYHKPQILSSAISVVPPAYTGINSDEFEQSGDIIVPYGSQITWNFNIEHSDSFIFYIDTIQCQHEQTNDRVAVKKNAIKPFDYHYIASGSNNSHFKSELFHVKLIPDYYPQIEVVSIVDSTASNSLFFAGRISDDYGFHQLTFNYFDTDNPKNIKSQKIDISNSTKQNFNFYFDFDGLSKSVSYYFQISDNDAVSGFKSTKSTISVYTTISNEEKLQRIDNLNSSIFDKIEQSRHLLNDLNRDLNDFQKNISSNNKISDWEKQLKLNSLMEKHNKLQDILNELSQDNQSKNAFENQLSPEITEEILNKQKQIQQLWDNLLTDDIKELLEKINELANSINEKDFRDNIQDLKFDFNQISEQLDRNNELMKMYNIDNRLQNLSKDINNIASEYRNLAKQVNDQNNNKTENNSKKSTTSESNNDNTNNSKSNSSDSLSNKMSDLKDLFNKLTNEYNNILKQNEELNNKLDIRDLNKKFDNIKEQISFQQDKLNELSDRFTGNKYENNDGNSEEDNKKEFDNSRDSNKSDNNGSLSNQRKQLSEQMEDTSEEMEELSDDIQGLKKENNKKKNQENLSDIRQILDNLVTISFAQESLISNLKSNTQNAFFSGDILRSQNSIVNDFSLVCDSIYALAKREPELGHSVYDKINTIHSYFTKTINSINQSRRVEVMNYQQNLLTNFNDLSLLFDEIADRMQNQQSQSNGSESESEQNTSKNKKEMQKRQQNTQQMQSQQQSLKDALQKMLERFQKGDKPTSQQLAESLKMQEMMLKKLQEMKKENGLSSDEQKIMNELNRMMEENKKDIINRNINKNLINRQNSILNKMLDLEKAEKSQDYDDKRESNSGIDLQNNNNKHLDIKFKDYNTKEFINTPPVDLNLFYKNKYNDYIQNIE